MVSRLTEHLAAIVLPLARDLPHLYMLPICVVLLLCDPPIPLQLPLSSFKRSSALGASSSGDSEGLRGPGATKDAVVGSPKELARMGVLGLCCMVCRLKMRYIPFVALAHQQARGTRGDEGSWFYNGGGGEERDGGGACCVCVWAGGVYEFLGAFIFLLFLRGCQQQATLS